MAELFLPVLSHFQNENPWTSGIGRLRCRILPTVGKEEGDGGILTAEVWEGPWAYEYSTVEAKRAFPLSEAGLAQLPAWLEEWRVAFESRPQRSWEENAQRRDAVALLREGTREKPVTQES